LTRGGSAKYAKVDTYKFIVREVRGDDIKIQALESAFSGGNMNWIKIINGEVFWINKSKAARTRAQARLFCK